MITNINYNHFYYFWQVSRAGSIAAASKVLCLTPQTVSAQISMLEQRLGKALFQREGRNLKLTEYGKLTKRYADDIFLLAQEWLETSQSNDNTLMKTIRVGVSDALPKSLVSLWLSPIIESEEPINLVCIDGSQADLLANLAVHKLDLVLTDKPCDNQYHVKAFNHEIGKSEIGFFSPNSWITSFQHNYPRCLTEKKLLMPAEDSPISRAIRYWANENKLEITIAGYVDDSALMKALAQRGSGIFPAPLLIQEEIEQNYGVKCLGTIDNIFQSYYLITPERLITSDLVSKIITAARAIYTTD